MQEGVRRITNRMEAMNKLKREVKLGKIKLLFAVVVMAIMMAVIVAQGKQIKELKQANADAVAVQIEIADENANLEERIAELESKILELEKSVASVDNFIEVAEAMTEVEDMAREAITHAEEVTELSYMYHDGVGTNIQYVDYVLDVATQKIVRTFQNDDQTFVVYISGEKAVEELEEALWWQYYSGLEDYASAVNSCDNVVLIPHHNVE